MEIIIDLDKAIVLIKEVALYFAIFFIIVVVILAINSRRK